MTTTTFFFPQTLLSQGKKSATSSRSTLEPAKDVSSFAISLRLSELRPIIPDT